MKFDFLNFLIGMPLGFFFFWIFFRIKKGGFEDLANHLLDTSQMEIDKRKNAFELELKEREFSHTKRVEALLEQAQKKQERDEARFEQREEKLDQKLQMVVKRLSEIEKKENALENKLEEVNKKERELFQQKERIEKQFENMTGLSSAAAQELWMQKFESDLVKEGAKMASERLQEVQENIDQEVAKLLSSALNRLAMPSISQITVTTVALPNDEIKGRIVGREGRNIRHLEMLTGVNFVMDETPGAVCLSSFDPMRKQIAKIALTDLIKDGRIHPTTIEEAVERAKESLEKEIKERGEEAAARAGVFHLHPALINLLGKLYFRFSYGQNVLDHSVEVAHIMGLMAGELKLDASLARRIGLLHDIGKAASQEESGSHAIVGHNLALKYGETPSVANGIGSHHHEMKPTTVEGSFCSIADQISGGRLGARTEAIENYIKRLGKLEMISSQYPGVERAYALQAGREVRVIVVPELVSDQETLSLARTLAKRIEEELTYPGKIKVTVVREKKAIEYAS